MSVFAAGCVPGPAAPAYNGRVTTLAENHGTAVPGGETSLPWRWFEFRRPPRAPGWPLPEDPDAVYAIDVDSQTIAFKFIGRRPGHGGPRPVLMPLHGMGLTIASFRGVAPYLLATHDLLCPDYSGLALNHLPLPEPASFKTFVTAIWRLADALRIERLSLAGNSLGGGLALMAALAAPERVERIVLANPACFPQTLPTMYRQARVPLWGELLMALGSPERLMNGLEYIGYVDKSRFDPALRAIYTANMATRRNRLRLMQLIRQLPANAQDVLAAAYLPRLREVRQPVLVSWGGQDPLLAEGAGERLAAALPQATYDPYPDLSHVCHEEAPERIGPRWAGFLNQGGRS
jgi:pimeloyl-ACP methyl ester carboxylesterase